MNSSDVPVDHCETCGTPLSAAIAHGFCYRCLTQAAFIDDDEALEEETQVVRSGMKLGQYVLLERLAQGGMGTVYRARQTSLQRDVAIKVPNVAIATNEEMARFRAEAEAVAALHHPNILTIHEVAEVDGQAFFSMDLVEGVDLDVLTRSGPLPARRAVELTIKIADAIQHAHDRGVLHRDLKPSNVLVDSSGEPQVTDFGLAKRVPTGGGAVLPMLTLSGQVLGTPGYLSPEQAAARSGSVGPLSDVYGLAALLYHLLTGRAPFLGDSPTAVLRQVEECPPIAPHLLNDSVPRALERICLKGMAKEPSRRYASAAALRDDLRRFLAGEPILARSPSSFERAWRWCRRKPELATLSLILLLLLGAAGGWVRHQWLYVWEHQVICGEIIRTVHGPWPIPIFDQRKWKQRAYNLRVTQRGAQGPVVRVESVSGDGNLAPGSLPAPFYLVFPPSEAPQVMDLSYDDRGRLLEETARSGKGRVISRIRWSYPTDAGDHPRTARVDYFDAASEALRSGAATYAARLHAETPGPDALWDRVEFLDAAGEPALGQKGVYGMRQTRPVPSEIVVEYLGKDGKLMNNSDGVARRESRLDASVTRQEVRAFDSTNRPVSAEGYHLKTVAFDTFGNPLEIAYFQGDEKTPARQIIGDEQGASHSSRRYDAHGRLVSNLLSGCDAASVGYAASKETREWFETGEVLYRSLTEFLDAEGHPCRNTEGFLKLVREVDRFHNVLRERVVK